MPENIAVPLIVLALSLPTLTILPVVLHMLGLIKELTNRIGKLEKLSKCPFDQ